MISLDDEIKELKQSFDDCDFGGGETKRLFEIIEKLQSDVTRLRDLNNHNLPIMYETNEKIQRYEQALKDIADSDENTPFSRHIILFARRTLNA